jgi:uncharacterized membrane protein HdeD (DUF308 family)
MSNTVIGIILICVGAFATAASFARPPAGMAPWKRWRLIIGGPVAVILGILLLTGVIG